MASGPSDVGLRSKEDAGVGLVFPITDVAITCLLAVSREWSTAA